MIRIMVQDPGETFSCASLITDLTLGGGGKMGAATRMQAIGLSSRFVELRSIEEAQIAEIHRHQNGELNMELSDFMRVEMPWVPLSLNQVKAKLEERQKEERTAVFGIWSKNNEFVGLGVFDASWDPWCPHINVIIFPQHRRKGYGSETVRLLLKAAFDFGIANVVGCAAPEWNTNGIAFAESLGFKKAGVLRRVGVFNGKFFDLVFLDVLRGECTEREPKGAD